MVIQHALFVNYDAPVDITMHANLTWWSTVRLWLGIRVAQLGLWIIGNEMDVEVR